jgi:hypothetical protein
MAFAVRIVLWEPKRQFGEYTPEEQHWEADTAHELADYIAGMIRNVGCGEVAGFVAEGAMAFELHISARRSCELTIQSTTDLARRVLKPFSLDHLVTTEPARLPPIPEPPEDRVF